MVPLKEGTLCHQKERETDPLEANWPGEATGVSSFDSLSAPLPLSLGGDWLTKGLSLTASFINPRPPPTCPDKGLPASLHLLAHPHLSNLCQETSLQL